MKNESINQNNFETHIIDNIGLFNELTEYIKDNKFTYCAFDTETDSEIEKKAKLYGMGLCFRDNEAFYLVYRGKDGRIIWNTNELSIIHNWIDSYMRRFNLLAHNGSYDILVLENNLNIDLTHSLYSDTILLKHTLSEETPFALKVISKVYLGDWADKAEEKLKENVISNGGKFTKECKQMFLADTQVLAEYCNWDVILVWKLFELFSIKLKEEDLEYLFYTEVMPVYKNVTINMKRKGLPINVPYFQELQKNINNDINRLEKEIMEDIKYEIEPFESKLLEEEFPVRSTGNFPKAVARFLNIPLPENKEGKITLSRKELIKFKNNCTNGSYLSFYNWLLEEYNIPISDKDKKTIQLLMFKDKYPDSNYVFNIKSKDHLIYLIHDRLGIKVQEKTETGKPKIDSEALESLTGKHPFVDKIIDYNKLIKLKGTYIDSLLEQHIDGIVYCSMKQFGTTSGRFSCTKPNLQTLPRPKEEDSGLSELVLRYTNSIRRGFIAPKGYKLVDLDYQALEPRCFAHACGDKNLQSVFFSGEDLYSAVAKRIYNLDNSYSTFKKDNNFLGKLKPELRQTIKKVLLAVVYGAEASRISEILNVSYNEAEEVIQNYLLAYPGLKKYMATCDYEAKNKGLVKTIFGRVRHLERAKVIYSVYGNSVLDWRYANSRGLKHIRREFKNLLNNSKNYKIQGLASHICNKAALEISLEIKKRNIDGYLGLLVHDQIICIVKEDKAEEVREFSRQIAENIVKLDVPLIAEPKIASNMMESH